VPRSDRAASQPQGDEKQRGPKIEEGKERHLFPGALRISYIFAIYPTPGLMYLRWLQVLADRMGTSSHAWEASAKSQPILASPTLLARGHGIADVTEETATYTTRLCRNSEHYGGTRPAKTHYVLLLKDTKAARSGGTVESRGCGRIKLQG
jgi:hypothetical protein